MEKAKYNNFNLEVWKGNCFEIMNISCLLLFTFEDIK